MKKWGIIAIVSAAVTVSALVIGFLYIHFRFELRPYVYANEPHGYINIDNLNDFDWKDTVVEINKGDPDEMILNFGVQEAKHGSTMIYGVDLEDQGIDYKDYRIRSVKITATTPIFRRSIDVEYIARPPKYQ